MGTDMTQAPHTDLAPTDVELIGDTSQRTLISRWSRSSLRRSSGSWADALPGEGTRSRFDDRRRRRRPTIRPWRSLAHTVGALCCTLSLAPAAGAAPVVKVDGARLVDGAGTAIQLRGVNRSGTEYACSGGPPAARGYSIFDGPRYDAPNFQQPEWMFDAMSSWGITAVRIPLSEHCWLGDVPSLNPAFSGAPYRKAIRDYVDQLGENGMIAILDLHVAGPDAAPNLDGALLPMPDTDNAPTFWAQVAKVFKTRTHVIYDAFNEPHLWEIDDDAQRWTCWRDGCTVDPDGPAPAYQTAGMRQIVNAIRRAGSTQPIMLGGLGYSSLLEHWTDYLPADSARSLVASFHNYPPPIGGCTDEACWNTTIDAIRLAGHPVVTGEVGQYDCNHDYLQRYLDWADAHGSISYLAWAWDETDPPSAWTCASPSLITSYDGTPTQTFGETYRAHLLSR
jgi:endoglucanase